MSLTDHETIIKDIIVQQKHFFSTHKTRSIAFRLAQLKKLQALIIEHENEIAAALFKDLRKSEFEAFATEIGFTLVELKKAIKNVKRWSKPKKVKTPPFHYVATSYVQPEPYGTTLIMAPWNYPFMLLVKPMIGAMAAGNTVVLKPSEVAPHTAELLTKLINEHFDQRYLHVINGDAGVAQALLEHKFDYVFFTGSTQVGKLVYQAAAKHLTPVTLELGGKSPCIVDTDIHIDYAAKRMIWGKLINAGQTCIAPDYLLINAAVKEAFIERVKHYIHVFYGENPQESPDLARIINKGHFDRISAFLNDGDIIEGGQTDANDLYIAPTLMEHMSMDAPVMQEEIFGPILPVITYNNISEAIQYINAGAKPLALYVFSRDKNLVKHILANTSSGGVTVNDTLMHITNPALPFGGVGDSGIGAYHGKHSFELFSHQKSVLHRSFLIEEPIRYAPFKIGVRLLKKIMDLAL